MTENYQTRLERIKKAVKREGLPDKVPVAMMFNGWIVEYYGASLLDYYRDKPEITPDIYKKGIEVFGFDAAFNLNNVSSYKSTEAMGGGMYSVSENGIQVSNIATSKIMHEDEYPLLTADFIGYLRDCIMPRRFSKLSGGNTEEAFCAIKTAFEEKNKFFSRVIKTYAEIEQNGCPIMWGNGVLMHPIDFILDYLRDFSGITIDMRRRPQAVMDAMGAIQTYFTDKIHSNFKSDENCKGPFWPTHLACFLKPKDFEKFYFPYFNETLKLCIKNNVYGAIVLEGDWVAYFDIMQELPDNNCLIGSMETGDYKVFKEKMGKKFTLCGGIPVSLLSFGTKQDCIDQTKKLLDDCAPGGGFIVDSDKALLNLRDAKAENLKTVIETVDKYGRY